MRQRTSDRATIGNRTPALCLLLTLLLALPCPRTGAAEPADPPYYAKKATWLESMLLARQALAQQGTKSSFKTYVSEVIRAGQPARPIRLSIAGQQELYLYVVGAPELVRACADLCDPRLIDTQGNQQLICDLKGIEITADQHSLHANLESGVSGPLMIGGKQFDHGIHVYANARIRVPLGGKFDTFEAMFGIDDWVEKYLEPGQAHGQVRFIITDAAGASRLDLWDLVYRDFSEEAPRRQIKWQREDRILLEDWQSPAELAQRYAQACGRIPPLAALAQQRAGAVRDAAGLLEIIDLYHQSRALDAALARARTLSFRPLRMAIEDLSSTFPGQYAGRPYLERLSALEKALPAALAALPASALADYQRIEKLLADFDQLHRQATLANPLMDFEKLLLIRRTPHRDPRMPMGTGYGVGEYIGLPRQTSKHSPDIEKHFDWENEIATLSPPRPDGKLSTLFKSDGKRLINDVDLHWDADKLLFAMPGDTKKWHIFEMGLDGQPPRQVIPGDQPDVHYYDPCYLPSGKIAFISTACLQGVPCNAGVIVGMMYTMNPNGTGIKQICFEQDHDYYPTVMNDGRIMYLRWDYTDTPHVWNRMLFTCNPDGTSQMEYYGANSYWPNAIFYARPIPNHPTRIAGIVTGHHVGRVGDLVIFDPTKGRTEADGVVQRVPGYGQKVQPHIQDKLTEFTWPKLVHPWPLNDKYFIVAAKPTPDSLWGIYLVDVFDNMTLIKELDGQALLEPIPVIKRSKPPVIPERTRTDTKDALVYLEDVYTGVSMKDIPRGAVKKLRVFAYHFGYQRLAGIDHRIGADGPWEAKRVLGTVNVEPDGSAFFKIPAKTPFSVQPLDESGKAVQLMRSWMTAMPGETLSCVGCHDNRNNAPPSKRTLALARPAQEIEPWHGQARGFSFKREVQPILDKYCVGCHNGKPRDDGQVLLDLRAEQGFFYVFKGGDPKGQIIRDTPKEQLLGKFGGVFEPAYLELRRFVRVGGLESDLHLLPPMEFEADTSELIQMLKKGHHNVQLSVEAWERLYTWIDLNAPCHGTWQECYKITGNQRDRRRQLQRLYGGLDYDPEEIPLPALATPEPILPPPAPKPAAPLQCEGWPFDGAQAARRQAAAGPLSRTFDIAGVKLELVRIPAGRFVMGEATGPADEQPQAAVSISRPFWMAKVETTNELFARFDAAHDSRFEHRSSWIFAKEYLGWPVNEPRQPVVRVSWQQAMAFCQWLSQQTGQSFTLPTEAQWEWACRAGSDSPLSFGDLNADFSAYANLGDNNIRKWAYEGWRPKSPDIFIRDSRFDDGAFVTAPVGSYRPNAFGLHDMHGNAAEWTRSAYAAYPYREDDGRNDPSAPGLRAVRGGSFFDRPQRARSAFRFGYQPYQRVYNVGFRVICEEQTGVAAK